VKDFFITFTSTKASRSLGTRIRPSAILTLLQLSVPVNCGQRQDRGEQEART
jgi:hypothetical protein